MSAVAAASRPATAPAKATLPSKAAATAPSRSAAAAPSKQLPSTTTVAEAGNNPGAEVAERKAKVLFDEGSSLVEVAETMRESGKDASFQFNKGLKMLREAAALGNQEAAFRAGHALLALADDDDDERNEEGPEAAGAGLTPLPTVDAQGRPAGGRRSAIETKLEITRLRNTNRGKAPPPDRRREGLEMLLGAAAAGHSDSMVHLGKAWYESYANRQGLTQLGVTAQDVLLLFQAASEATPPHPDALFNMALLLHEGAMGELPREPARALQLMERAAKEGKDPHAMLWLGKHFLEDDQKGTSQAMSEEEVEQAVLRGWEYVHDAADGGFAPAMTFAAEFLYSVAQRQRAELGEDGEMLAAARRYLEEAVRREDADALFFNAQLLCEAEGSFMGNTGADYVAALRLFERAGMEGHAEAWTQAGAMHYQGLGTPRSTVEAYRAYERGAQEGSLSCYKNIADMHERGDPPLEKNAAVANEMRGFIARCEADIEKHANAKTV